MTRPLVIDAFMFHDELDMLECRLTELGDAVDWFVLVQADVTHQDDPKPWYFDEHAERFAPWASKIVNVHATDLPTRRAFPDPWAREHAQREWIAKGLQIIGAGANDVLLQSDVDEIPRALHARNVRPDGMVAFGQRGLFWAVDWLYPFEWRGTVAARCGFVAGLGDSCFSKMRDARNTVPRPPYLADAGWHLSWLGGPERAAHKVGAFCHPEVEDRIKAGISDDFFYREGFHVDGQRMTPVEVDDTWPRWIRERRCPASWFRPRVEVAA